MAVLHEIFTENLTYIFVLLKKATGLLVSTLETNLFVLKYNLNLEKIKKKKQFYYLLERFVHICAQELEADPATQKKN